MPVQPRSRGELNATPFSASSTVGSTPLARGTQLRQPESGLKLRFNPARAGNSYVSAELRDLWPVQPRSRGELSGLNVISGEPNGSTPLARGTQKISLGVF